MSKLDRQSDTAQLFQEDKQLAWVEADRREPEKRRSRNIGSTLLYVCGHMPRGVACINLEPQLVRNSALQHPRSSTPLTGSNDDSSRQPNPVGR
jgi:hypothetical protein